jgi:hypothetical protein
MMGLTQEYDEDGMTATQKEWSGWKKWHIEQTPDGTVVGKKLKPYARHEEPENIFALQDLSQKTILTFPTTYEGALHEEDVYPDALEAQLKRYGANVVHYKGDFSFAHALAAPALNEFKQQLDTIKPDAVVFYEPSIATQPKINNQKPLEVLLDILKQREPSIPALVIDDKKLSQTSRLKITTHGASYMATDTARAGDHRYVQKVADLIAARHRKTAAIG